MADLVYVVLGLLFFALMALTRMPVVGCEGNAMIEPIIGLIVGVSLGAYLLYTLIHPEKF